MTAIKLSSAHLEKRKEKKLFSLRYDIFGSHLMQTLSPKDYFDLCFSYPKDADRDLTLTQRLVTFGDRLVFETKVSNFTCYLIKLRQR